MPRPLTILSSLISIMYIGVGKLPKNWLRSTFRVRREAVATALAWLKTNNPKYYGDIEICTESLKQLPDDDVPDEILSIVHQSDDVGILDQEGAGYTRTDDIGMKSIHLCFLPTVAHLATYQWIRQTGRATWLQMWVTRQTSQIVRAVFVKMIPGRSLWT